MNQSVRGAKRTKSSVITPNKNLNKSEIPHSLDIPSVIGPHSYKRAWIPLLKLKKIDAPIFNQWTLGTAELAHCVWCYSPQKSIHTTIVPYCFFRLIRNLSKEMSSVLSSWMAGDWSYCSQVTIYLWVLRPLDFCTIFSRWIYFVVSFSSEARLIFLRTVFLSRCCEPNSDQI